MATYTDNYQLTKPLYSETADVAAINNNMDKIDDIMHASQVSLAPAYDQNETYNTGDVVMYEFLMYECLEDEVTGVWDATKWQRTTAREHGGGSSASEVSYDNTDSGMTATNVQDAIDELKGEIEDIPSVEANPQGAATEELTKIEIGSTIYEIVGGETIYGKASGAVANFDDGSANPLVDLKININAVQSGSGTPSRSNPMPISGWTGAEIHVADGEEPHVVDNEYNISWQTEAGEVFGGTSDVTSGELTVDSTIVDLGSLTWVKHSSGNFFYSPLSDAKYETGGAYIANALCTNYKITNPSALTNQDEVFAIGTYFLASCQVYVRDTAYLSGTASDFKTAMNGVKLVYELATPLAPISLTPTQITALLGTNNIWSDTGDCEVEYIRDINKAFNILWDAVMNQSNTRSLSLTKSVNNIEESEKEETEKEIKKEGNDENQR